MTRVRSSRWALRRGQNLARAGRGEEALAAFDAAGDGPGAPLLVQEGLALARIGRGEAALEKLDRAAAAAPEDAVPAVFRAYVMLRLGRLADADPEIERAAKLSPQNPIPTTLRAALELLKGKLAEGCRKLQEGPLTDNLEILGWVLALVERGIFEKVGTDSGAIPPEPDQRVKPDIPPDPAPELGARRCQRRGERFLETGRPKTAAKYLERAVKLRPEDPELRVLYGAALFEAGEFARAEAELAQTPDKSPMAGVARLYRATTAYRLGLYDAAVGFIDSLPATGTVFSYREWCDYIRGMALVALGRTPEAAGHLARFLDFEPALFDRRLKKARKISEEGPPCSTSS